MKKRMVCFYHFNCPDGIFAAWVVKQAHEISHDITYIPHEWNKPIPVDLVSFDVIVFVDIAPTLLQLRQMMELKEKNIIILDHHDTTLNLFKEQASTSNAIDNMLSFSEAAVGERIYQLRGGNNQEMYIDIVLDMDHSGAGLAYEHFKINVERIKHVIDMVEDRDLFRFKLKDSKNLYYATQQHVDLTNPNTLELFKIIDEVFFAQDIRLKVEIDKGNSIRLFCEEKIKQYAQTYQMIQLEGLEIPLINVHKDWGSDTCMYMVQNMGFTRSAYFVFAENDIYLGFRSISEDYPINGLAAKFGGGGHKCAAACHLNLETFTNLLQGAYK